MDAKQAMYHIANRKQWEARMAEIHEMLSQSMPTERFNELVIELIELRDKLEGKHGA